MNFGTPTKVLSNGMSLELPMIAITLTVFCFRLLLSGADTLSLLASGLTLFQQHLLGALFTAIEGVARDNGNAHALNALARSAARAVLRPPAATVRYLSSPPHYCFSPSLL